MITFFEWSIWLFYVVLILLTAFILPIKKENKSYVLFGLGVKILGALFFSLIFIFYYGFGDSFEYYKGGVELGKTMYTNPTDYLELLFHESSNNFPVHLRQYTDHLAYSDTPEEWFMVKLISPITNLSFHSYLVLNLFLSLFSFFGSWNLFKVFKDLFNGKKTLSFIIAFCIPTVLFWGSGLMKDTLTLAFLNYIIYILYNLFVKKNFKVVYIIGLVISFWIIYNLKSYIILAFLPSVFYLIYHTYKSRVESKVVKIIMVPFLIAIIAGAGYYSINTLSESNEKYNAESLKWKAKGFHTWHTTLGGSSYDLGEIEYTAAGAAKKIPASLNVTFFRPYPWEAKSIVVVLTSVESMVIFLFFIYILIRYNFKIISIMRTEYFLRSLIPFIIIFGYVVGFTSYNFGALARYKMPIMSLFIVLMIYIHHKANLRLSDTSEKTSS